MKQLPSRTSLHLWSANITEGAFCSRFRDLIFRAAWIHVRSVRHDRISSDSVSNALRVARDLASLISSSLRSRAQLATENLFLKKQLALYLERQVKPRRADDATRATLVALSRFVDWRRLLTIVKPDTLLRWHRKGFWLFWRWKSKRPGRPPIPTELQELIATMAAANRTWGEERITN